MGILCSALNGKLVMDEIKLTITDYIFQLKRARLRRNDICVSEKCFYRNRVINVCEHNIILMYFNNKDCLIELLNVI